MRHGRQGLKAVQTLPGRAAAQVKEEKVDQWIVPVCLSGSSTHLQLLRFTERYWVLPSRPWQGSLATA